MKKLTACSSLYVWIFHTKRFWMKSLSRWNVLPLSLCYSPCRDPVEVPWQTYKHAWLQQCAQSANLGLWDHFYTVKCQCFILTCACLRRKPFSCRLPMHTPSQPQLAPPSSWKYGNSSSSSQEKLPATAPVRTVSWFANLVHTKIFQQLVTTTIVFGSEVHDSKYGL